MVSGSNPEGAGEELCSGFPLLFIIAPVHILCSTFVVSSEFFKEKNSLTSRMPWYQILYVQLGPRIHVARRHYSYRSLWIPLDLEIYKAMTSGKANKLVYV